MNNGSIRIDVPLTPYPRSCAFDSVTLCEAYLRLAQDDLGSDIY